MDRIINQFFSDGNVIKTDYNLNPHRPINNPNQVKSAHQRSNTMYENPNPLNNSQVLRSNAQMMINPEERNAVYIMNLKINALQQQQEKENKELLEIIKKSIENKNGGNLNQGPMMSSMKPNPYGNPGNAQHPGYNPYYQPHIPRVNKFNEYESGDTPPRKRRHKAMELEELNENIELMQEELNKNISN